MTDKDCSLAKDSESGRVEKDHVRAKAQQTPKKIPHDSQPPRLIQCKQALASMKGEHWNVGATECDARPARFVRGEQFEIPLFLRDRKVELARIDRSVIASRDAKEAKARVNVRPNVEMNIGGNNDAAGHGPWSA